MNAFMVLQLVAHLREEKRELRREVQNLPALTLALSWPPEAGIAKGSVRSGVCIRVGYRTQFFMGIDRFTLSYSH